MKTKVTKLIGALLLFNMVIGLTACGGNSSDGAAQSGSDAGSASDNVLHIAYVGSGVEYPADLLGVAMDQGYLEEELANIGWSYEASSFTGGNLVNEALISGEADFGELGDVPALTSKSKGAETSLLAGEVYASDAGLVVSPDSEIESVQDLKGKTVATLEGSYMQMVLIHMLEDNGLSIDDVQFTNMTSADAAAAVQTGSIDAALLSEVQYSVAVAENQVKVLLSGSENNSWRGSTVLVANNNFIESHRDVVVAVLKAYVRANEYALSDYEGALDSLAKSGMSVEALQVRFPEEVNYNLRADSELTTAMESVQEFVLDIGNSSTEVDLESWIDSSILEEAEK